MRYEVKGNLITIDGNQTIEFDYCVKSVVAANEILIVLLDIPPNVAMSENVFAISDKGKILWQIQRRQDSTGNNPEDVYVNLGYKSQDEVVIYHWQCLAVTVDVHTGMIKSISVTK